MIYAHRGASADEPANTLAAFRRAMSDGADGIELDVFPSRDGVPMVLHDRDLEHTTNGQGRVDDTSLADLKRLDAGRGEAIPTLHEVLDLVSGHLRVYVEVKHPEVEAETLDVLAKFPEAAWIAASLDPEILRALRELAPKADLWLIAKSLSDDALKIAGELSLTTISLWSEATSPAVAARLFQADLDLAVWTVNDVAVARQAALLGASAICTDKPRLIREGLWGAGTGGS